MLLFAHGIVSYGLEKAALAERRKAVVGHDQVIVELDADQLARPLHGAGELDVLGRRVELARRMVVYLMFLTSLCVRESTPSRALPRTGSSSAT